MLNLTDIPLDARLERIALLGEALDHELAELWHQCHYMARAIAPSVHIPTAAIEGDVLKLSSRPVEMIRQELRQGEAA